MVDLKLTNFSNWKKKMDNHEIFDSFSIKEPKKKKDKKRLNKINNNEVVLCLPVPLFDAENKNVKYYIYN